MAKMYEDEEMRQLAQKQVNAGQTDSILDKILNREKFSYDMNTDAVYNQMKDRYIQQGQMASQDAMGQAAALTGGYGNSYAQGVATQAYQGYLQGLNDKVPDLYRLAQDRYNDETAALNNQYSLYLGKQKDNYNKLMGLITGVGYNPTADEIKGAGMTQAQVDALLNAWNAAHAPSDGGGSGGGGGGGDWPVGNEVPEDGKKTPAGRGLGYRGMQTIIQNVTNAPSRDYAAKQLAQIEDRYFDRMNQSERDALDKAISKKFGGR